MSSVSAVSNSACSSRRSAHPGSRRPGLLQHAGPDGRTSASGGGASPCGPGDGSSWTGSVSWGPRSAVARRERTRSSRIAATASICSGSSWRSWAMRCSRSRRPAGRGGHADCSAIRAGGPPAASRRCPGRPGTGWCVAGAVRGGRPPGCAAVRHHDEELVGSPAMSTHRAPPGSRAPTRKSTAGADRMPLDDGSRNGTFVRPPR